ncbi:MAG: class I SAM-dependent methyltransferase [Actinomycetota bacterium]|nr:class I SAM-dependent methyltransferase [Actinomycetota bacterium]
MTGCCNARGCDKVFGAWFADRVATKYRKKGLDKAARRMVAFLNARGVDGATVLEIGGGVGEIALELLKRDAARAVNLELSAAYEEQGRQLFREHGLEERVTWRVHDIAADPDAIEPADIVVLHRVVCCYPDYRPLLEAAADHARRFVVFSYPPRNPLSRPFVAGANLVTRAFREEFRAFVHPPSAMRAVVEERGFRPVLTHGAFVWQIATFEREMTACAGRGSVAARPWRQARRAFLS